MSSSESINEWLHVEKEIESLFLSDQNDRLEPLLDEKIVELESNDEVRLARAKDILKAYQEDVFTLSGECLWKLGCLFQHGRRTENYKIAFELAQQAIEAGYPEAEVLLKSAEDRYLLSIGEKQKWGTQEFEEGE